MKQLFITARIRRMGEGNVFSLSTFGGGGYPYPIMLCNIFQNAMGQPGGVPHQVQPGGYPGRGGGTLAGGVPCLGGVPWLGGTLARGGTLAGGVPWWGVPCLGGVPWPGGTLARGVPWLGGLPCLGGYPGQGGTQLGQHREYLLHGGQYASCVHAGGLSCFIYLF